MPWLLTVGKIFVKTVAVTAATATVVAAAQSDRREYPADVFIDQRLIRNDVVVYIRVKAIWLTHGFYCAVAVPVMELPNAQ